MGREVLLERVALHGDIVCTHAILLSIGISKVCCQYDVPFICTCMQAKLVERIGSLSSNLRAVADLTASREEHPEQPLFQTLPAPQFGMTLLKLLKLLLT